jgi:high affinity Mn2+ porin
MTQATWIYQAHPSFNSPYEGQNSLIGASEDDRSFSFSLFTGYRIEPGTEIYFDPEIFQGHSLSNTLGMAGFPNGESGKAAFPSLHYSTSRLYIRQTFGLGGDTEKLPGGEQAIGGAYDVNRITLTVGKMAANDIFDNNAYSGSARTQFMNWSLMESSAWDYPADVVGYTAGFAAGWNTRDWALNYGIFMEPTESNGAVLDKHVLDAHGQVLELDRRYNVGELAGTVRPFVYWNQARMGNYSDALAEPSIGNALIETRAYRSKVGFGLSWDQQLTPDVGAFARLSWDDGRTESFSFTEVDRSARRASASPAPGGAGRTTRWASRASSMGLCPSTRPTSRRAGRRASSSGTAPSTTGRRRSSRPTTASRLQSGSGSRLTSSTPLTPATTGPADLLPSTPCAPTLSSSLPEAT